jgi:ketosteroid isomerase-like protein
VSEENRRLIERFYAAFDRCDGEEMASLYAEDAHFCDPAFGDLHGPQVGAMWRMLTGRATDLEVRLASHDASESAGSANWVARYTFGATGRPVVNDVRATFRFADGLIAEHVDDFDFRRWARQALGIQGALVALVPPLRAKVRSRARTQLEEFMESTPSPLLRESPPANHRQSAGSRSASGDG